jgi:plasmid replication initiation protein
MTKKTELQKSNPYLVVQDNEFINFRNTLTVQEARVFLSMVAQVEKDDAEFKVYKIEIDKFVEAVGLKRKDMHEELKKVSDQLTSKKFRKEKEDGSFLITNYVSSAEYRSGEGFIELTFDPKLKPYLLGLKSKFTQYDIRNILALRSIFSILLFQLLKQFEKIGERTFNLIDLKYKLNVDDKYQDKYNNFKMKVLEVAEKEIKENCDIYFEYEELKQGKKVIGIKFFIYSQTPPREQIKAIGEPKQPEQPERPKVQDIDFEEVQEPQRPPQQQTTTAPPTAPNTPSMAMIQELGEKALFTPEQVAEIVDYFDNDYIKAWEALKGYTDLKAQNHPIERPLAYIFKSKSLGSGLWESQQQKAKTAQNKQLKGVIENIKNEYRQRKREQQIKLYEEANEAQKKMLYNLISEEPKNIINNRNIAINQETKNLNTFGLEQAGEMLANAQDKGANYRQPKYRKYIFEKYNIQINFDDNDEVVY